MSIKLVTLGVCLAALLSFVLLTASKHNNHDGMGEHMAKLDASTLPSEGGQSMFAALIELVEILERDADTNWEEISIDGLHAHLLDMDNLMRKTVAESITTDNTISFDIRGTTESIPSIHKMVPAHANFIQDSRNWIIITELIPTGATITIEVNATEEIVFLAALGFYGFMSLDSHHQAHHYQMVHGMSH